MSKTLHTFAGILRELRIALPKVTPEKVCRSGKAANHLASTYLCYLQSNRIHQELLEAYQGRGERSIEESANLVGLKLPKTPED